MGGGDGWAFAYMVTQAGYRRQGISEGISQTGYLRRGGRRHGG
jgi:hypothetical protein